MAIRFLLVSLVAGLSLELPSNDEINGWAKAGRTWVAARLDDWSVTTAQRAREANDRAFRTIVDDMSRSFSADLARLDAAKRPDRALAAFEPIEVPDELETGIAFELNRQEVAQSAADLNPKAEARPAPAFEPILVADTLEDPAAFVLGLDSPVAEKAEPAVAAPVAARTDRTEQISSALQLTRQALTAWASVLQGSNTIVRR